jgi:hypothetical protein
MAPTFRIAALALFALAGCYKVDNPDFCCVDATDCEAHGASQPVACNAPLVCDAAKFTCVDPTNGGHCSTPEDCAGTVTPYCVMNICKQCASSDMGCTAASPVCSADNACAGCTGDPDCAAYAQSGTPHCGSTGACVQCRDSTDCTGDVDAPVCDLGVCRACKMDSDCDSQTCDRETGACVPENAVIYISPTGTSTGPCTKAAPCGTFAQAIAQLGAKTIIKAMPGSYVGEVTLTGVTASIYADGATLSTTSTNKSIVVVSNGANVTIQGLHVTGAGGTANPPGIICSNGGSTPTMRLHRMRIDGNGGGGVSITSCDFSLVNDFIVQNGSALSPSGGVSIATISGAGTHQLDFVTIAGNTASAGINTGIDCFQVTSALTFSSNIVFDNQVSSGGKQVSGNNCNYVYSDISDSVNGTGNITTSPSFLDPSNSDYHLMQSSLAIDVADPGANLRVDYDGDKRPAGNGRDIGADEAK